MVQAIESSYLTVAIQMVVGLSQLSNVNMRIGSVKEFKYKLQSVTNL